MVAMNEKTMRATTPSECPVCGARVPPNARACPECGADERTGWNEEATRYDGLDLPDEAFDADEGSRQRTQPKRASLFWWIIGLVILAISIIGVFATGF